MLCVHGAVRKPSRGGDGCHLNSLERITTAAVARLTRLKFKDCLKVAVWCGTALRCWQLQCHLHSRHNDGSCCQLIIFVLFFSDVEVFCQASPTHVSADAWNTNSSSQLTAAHAYVAVKHQSWGGRYTHAWNRPHSAVLVHRHRRLKN